MSNTAHLTEQVVERLRRMVAETDRERDEDNDNWEALATGQDTQEAEESGRLAGYAEALREVLEMLQNGRERMSTSTEASPFDLAERRAARLAMVLEGYEVGDEGMPDSSVPGAARVEYVGAWSTAAPRVPRKHPPFVLLTQYGDKGNYRAYLANDVANVEQLARLAVCDGESIVAYFDLDKLAGHESGSWDDYDRRVPDDEVGVVERVEPDERMPVRYGLAKVVVSVVFNTVPSPA